ncbi:uncharacterized protein LOC112579384 isoform X2 [Bubalus bubalis]|uniref:uncharacterized protein LOC112579384 isoform X2 n=1 Tax=Bubalus bubalis TaxID=89462 RepID=UPI001D127D2E|nr:uncharacterized protein LOC112579384 isoform X2 [Bubalus bubalis]
MQEKSWKYTRIKTPLALVTLPQKKQRSYPTSWSAEAEVVAGCCSCRDSAWRRAPVQGEKQRCNIFKVSQSIQLHPDDLRLCWVMFSNHLLYLFCVIWKLEKIQVAQRGGAHRGGERSSLRVTRHQECDGTSLVRRGKPPGV